MVVMCHGDTALEGRGPYSEEPEDSTGTLGLGTTHVCTDWNALFDWAEDHAVEV